jgi:hypothetical protein
MDATETDAPKLVCSFCGKTERQVRRMIAGPGINVCDECVDLLTDIVATERGKATIRRDLSLPPGCGLAGAVLMAGLPEHLEATHPGALVRLTISRDRDFLRLELEHADGAGETVAGALADYALRGARSEGAGPAGAAALSRRALEAAAGADPDAFARVVNRSLSNADLILMELDRLSGEATDPKAAAALDAIGDAVERGFDAAAEPEMRARLETVAGIDPAILAALRDAADRSDARGAGGRLAVWIREMIGPGEWSRPGFET